MHEILDIKAETAGELLLALLHLRGVECLFANAGTDFPAIVEAYARAPVSGLDLPRPVIVPHEHAALSMAHGHYLGSGRMQAAMVHVSVGIANSLCALLNARRENVPIFFAAGRTPITEAGDQASRDVSIHWGQEMFDQAGMLREATVWDYELRSSQGLARIVDRAMALAGGDAGGPVFLGLPREVLGGRPAETPVDSRSRFAPHRATGVDMAEVSAAAAILAGAERPLIVTSRAGRDRAAHAALADFANRTAIPVIEYRANYANLPGDHPMHAGRDFGSDFATHDAILVLDSIAPWLPARHKVPDRAPVIQIAPDPLSGEIPVRGFAADIAIAARPSVALPLLAEAFERALPAGGRARIAERHERLAANHRAAREARLRALLPDSGTPARMNRAWISRCLAQALTPDDIIVNEIGCLPALVARDLPGTFFGPSNAGGLGQGLPASLGLKLALPERRVIATLGDGSCMFANPVACHQTAAAHAIATLTIVFNNRRWNAVRESTLSVYPQGHAAAANLMPLTSLEPSPDFAAVGRACGGHGARIEDPAELPRALDRALAEIDSGRFALLDVHCDD